MINKPSSGKPGGIFDRGNFTSASKFDQTVRGLIGNRDKSAAISEELRKKIFEPSGLSKEETLRGLKALKAAGKLTQEDINRLKRRL